MFFVFPFQKLGFTEDQWEGMPRNDRVIIRDFELNNRDVDQTMFYDYYETSSKIRKVINRYNLKSRPQLQLSIV